MHTQKLYPLFRYLSRYFQLIALPCSGLSFGSRFSCELCFKAKATSQIQLPTAFHTFSTAALSTKPLRRGGAVPTWACGDVLSAMSAWPGRSWSLLACNHFSN